MDNKSDTAKYEVIVEMEHRAVLADEEEIKKAIEGRLKGKLFSSAVFAESGPHLNSLEHVRRFALSEESDFPVFSEAIKTIEGVIGVKKGDGDGQWSKTASEKRRDEKEKKRIAKERERLGKEDMKERKRKLAEFKKLDEETKKADDDKYGPPEESSKMNPAEFKKIVSSIGRCQVEGRVVTSDILAGGFLGYERVLGEVSSGDEAVKLLGEAINNELRIPFQAKTPFYEIPFRVEYRNKNGKSFINLYVNGGRPTFIMATYDLFIREL